MSAIRDQFHATVVRNLPLCREHFRIDLNVERFPATRPGQFVQISCRPVDAGGEDRVVEWDTEGGRSWKPEDIDLVSPAAVLRRPFSLAGRVGDHIQIIHRVVGIGTEWLEHLREGDRVGVLGPLGNAFELPGDGQQAILVGGGVGIPPMLYLATALAGREGTVAFSGATCRDLLPLKIDASAGAPAADGTDPLPIIREFSDHGISAVISTDDGSFGFRGFVTQALERYLDRSGIRGGAAVIYTCGPEAMMKRVADIALARQIPCQVAVERAMACGMGTCQSCCIRVRKPDPARPPLVGKDWCYRLACTDGPIFSAADLLW